MSLKRPFSDEDFTCSVCCDIFSDPVLLACGHSVCRACVRQYWATRRSRVCPLCRKRCAKNPPLNLALKNLCQTYLEVRGPAEALCDVHSERLKLFCVDDGRPACVVCRDSEKHIQHRFRPVDEVAPECKDIIKSALKTMAMEKKSLQDAQVQCRQKEAHISQQAQHIRTRIKTEFCKLKQFLQEELATMLSALEEEELQKIKSLKENIKTMGEEIVSLSNTIRQTTKELESEDITFLQNFEKTLEKAPCKQMNQDMTSTEVISAAKYLGNLQFKVWKKMQSIIKYSPVVLDPNTAHAQLVLSADLTSVRDSEDLEDETNVQQQQVPDIPERFSRSSCVLGSEGYSSGTHTWDVDVGNNTFWMLGVTTESVLRKEHRIFPSGAWGIGFDNEKLCVRSPVECMPLPVGIKSQVVRVYLDMNAGVVCFSDPVSSIVFHTFSHKFTEKVFPLFHSLCNLSPLKIVPLTPLKALGNVF